MVSRSDPDLWQLVQGSPWIDPAELLEAVRAQVMRPPHDYRTRLLLRESVAALEGYLGKDQTARQLTRDVITQLHALAPVDPQDVGFPSLRRRLMPFTTFDDIHRFFHDLGASLREPARIEVGGSIALMLAGLLRRHTEDVDVVDEIPAVFRGEHQLLDDLSRRFGLRLTHFQSHFLPEGWKHRLIDRGRFGFLDVWSVDPLDIGVSKLFSGREKDRDDLRVLANQMDRDELAARVATTAGKMLAEPALRAFAEHNWTFMFGEKLPD